MVQRFSEVDSSAKYLGLIINVWPGGGIGIRSGFKIRTRKGCEFESHSGYHITDGFKLKTPQEIKEFAALIHNRKTNQLAESSIFHIESEIEEAAIRGETSTCLTVDYYRTVYRGRKIPVLADQWLNYKKNKNISDAMLICMEHLSQAGYKVHLVHSKFLFIGALTVKLYISWAE